MIAIDVGNTKTAIGLFRGGALRRSWKIGTAVRYSADEYHRLLDDFLSSEGESLEGVGRAVVASVVPAVTEELSKLSSRAEMHFVTHESPLSFSIDIPHPETLGADRVAEVEGAVRKFEAPLIVVSLGTATTLSAVRRGAVFAGGVIAPGVTTAMDALFTHAALIPKMTLPRAERAIGRSTMEALASGGHLGHAAMIRSLIGRMEEEMGECPVRAVVTGGGLTTLLPYLEGCVTIEPSLTLEGLAFIGSNLRGEGSRRA